METLSAPQLLKLKTYNVSAHFTQSFTCNSLFAFVLGLVVGLDLSTFQSLAFALEEGLQHVLSCLSVLPLLILREVTTSTPGSNLLLPERDHIAHYNTTGDSDEPYI